MEDNKSKKAKERNKMLKKREEKSKVSSLGGLKKAHSRTRESGTDSGQVDNSGLPWPGLAGGSCLGWGSPSVFQGLHSDSSLPSLANG